MLHIAVGSFVKMTYKIDSLVGKIALFEGDLVVGIGLFWGTSPVLSRSYVHVHHKAQ